MQDDKKITEKQQKKYSIHESEGHNQLLADNLTDIISLHTVEGVYLYVSPVCKQLLGYEQEDLINHSFYEFCHPQDVAITQKIHLDFWEEDITYIISYRMRQKTGDYIWFESSCKKIQATYKKTGQEIILVSRNINERKQTEKLLSSQKQVLEMIATDKDLEITLNLLIQGMEEQLIGMLGSIMLVDTDKKHFKFISAPSLPSGYVQAFNGTEIGINVGSCGKAIFLGVPVIIADITQDPNWANFLELASEYQLQACWSIPIISNQGRVLGTFAIYFHQPRKPTEQEWQLIQTSTHLAGIAIERKEAKDKLQYHAYYDSLTRLPNRPSFINQLESVIQSFAPDLGYIYAVLFIDLDGFKVVNDSLGHVMGDELLKKVAHRLQASLRSTDKLARFGGDEFAILLEEIENSQEVIKLAERIQEQFKLPFTINEQEVFTSFSIGITTSIIGYDYAEEILRDVDTAMYRAKAIGKGRYAIFEPGMKIAALTRLHLENDLRRALELQELYLHYQPIIHLSTGALVGFEALLRWRHSSKGLISPVDFIPVAEETGLINEIGWWAFQEACRQLQIWQKCCDCHLIMNVNISAYQFEQKDLVEHIQEVLDLYEVRRGSLKLEITESCFLETISAQANIVKKLKSIDIGLSIDDFGTGYSSLSRLHEFPIDTLKIDRSFISSLDSQYSQRAIVHTIIQLAHSLEMNVVAEGIETIEQKEQLEQLGCELGQGYLFYKPLDSQTATQLVLGLTRNGLLK